MPVVYTFAFPARRYAGATCIIRDGQGATIETVTLPNTPNAGMITLHRTLAEDIYTAEAVLPTGGRILTEGVLDVVDSINGVAADQTAFFVATGPTLTSDGTTAPLTLVADSRHGDLPAWATIVDGEVVLGENAGTCACAVTAAHAFDFTGETAVDDPGYISGTVTVKLDGATAVNKSSDAQVGTGDTIQNTATARAGSLLVGTTVTLTSSAYADGDGNGAPAPAVATPSVALTITRIAQAAVPPE